MRPAATRCAGCPLKVRTRSTIGGDGEVASAESIFCPRLDRSIPMAECTSCEHHGGTVTSHERVFLYCADPAANQAQDAADRQQSAPATPGVHTQISAIMTGDVMCVRPELSVEALSSLLLERGFSGVPVVDEEGRPLGVVSKTDLVREVGEGGTQEAVWITRNGRPHQLERGFHLEPIPRATVADVMTPLAFALPENASISQAAALMVFEDIHRVLVVAEDGKVVGIVSSLDVLAWLAGHDGYLVRNPLWRPADSIKEEGQRLR